MNETQVVHDEVRAVGRMTVSTVGSDRVVFQLDADRLVRLVVRHDEAGRPCPLVTGVACSETLAHDLLAGYQWFGLEWLWVAMLDAMAG